MIMLKKIEWRFNKSNDLEVSENFIDKLNEFQGKLFNKKISDREILYYRSNNKMKLPTQIQVDFDVNNFFKIL